MAYPRTRRVQRVHLAQPLVGRLGAAAVVVVDISLLGARLELHTPQPTGSHARLSFFWDDEEIAADCRVVRSRLERFSTGSDGLTVYNAGVEFVSLPAASKARIKALIGVFITRALEEQKMNARGVIPHHAPASMPIFRHGGQLSANAKEVREGAGGSALPVSRLAKETGYICYQLDHSTWKKKKTHDPGQPSDGFTISALEDAEQAEKLCEAYLKSDPQGRKLIQLFAQLSIMEGEGIAPGRFEPGRQGQNQS